ncbi:MAG: hypothetical protein AAF530_02965 [Pseudomonadota bacterium]
MTGDFAALKARLDRLLRYRMSLEAAIKEIDHEGRRTRDGLERAGGRAHDLEQKSRQLTRNIDLNKKELMQLDQQIATLREQLAAQEH